ncbi:MarR family winged helix-turn-helix transcriptional regulator [Kozakia baliensis]|uniref:hypothetical protein n=1 Tax=Kozakia baliensis TaxID=153496 RepID=UPI00345C2A00
MIPDVPPVIWKVFSEREITRAQMHALTTIFKSKRPMTINEIADDAVCSRSSVSIAIKRGKQLGILGDDGRPLRVASSGSLRGANK